MSSRASTEVATGAAARSMRRWLGRAALPVVVRSVTLMVLALLLILLIGELVPNPFNGPRCFDCPPAPEHETILERFF